MFPVFTAHEKIYLTCNTGDQTVVFKKKCQLQFTLKMFGVLETDLTAVLKMPVSLLLLYFWGVQCAEPT